ncbi:hypothetical protein [Streptomyces sp. NBC_00083]|uniref:hypothetical protein n=1 Tax=Streptomyces sp. NBC_00083 TaxID=2975647 RepID=UPI002256A948|nr:hypothetical protein [Streptomyces sp. NBC_00083]MCX5387315.1 hypothetical protein [Streptomyces sp. NBC_00083]
MTSDDIITRITRVEAELAQPTPPPLSGQVSIPLDPIRHHAYTGDGGPCTTLLFGEQCAEPADDHDPSLFA